jgi:hypothetical protein
MWDKSTTIATGTLGAPDGSGNQTGTIVVPSSTPTGEGLLVGTVAASVDCMRPFTVT